MGTGAGAEIQVQHAAYACQRAARAVGCWRVAGDVDGVGAAIGVDRGCEQAVGALDVEHVGQRVGAFQIECVGRTGRRRVVNGVGAAETADGAVSNHDVGIIADGGVAEVADIDRLYAGRIGAQVQCQHAGDTGQGAAGGVERRRVTGNIDRVDATIGIHGCREQPVGTLDIEGIRQRIGAFQIKCIGAARRCRVVDRVGAAKTGDGAASDHDASIVSSRGVAEIADVERLRASAAPRFTLSAPAMPAKTLPAPLGAGALPDTLTVSVPPLPLMVVVNKLFVLWTLKMLPSVLDPSRSRVFVVPRSLNN